MLCITKIRKLGSLSTILCAYDKYYLYRYLFIYINNKIIKYNKLENIQAIVSSIVGSIFEPFIFNPCNHKKCAKEEF